MFWAVQGRSGADWDSRQEYQITVNSSEYNRRCTSIWEYHLSIAKYVLVDCPKYVLVGPSIQKLWPTRDLYHVIGRLLTVILISRGGVLTRSYFGQPAYILTSDIMSGILTSDNLTYGGQCCILSSWGFKFETEWLPDTIPAMPYVSGYFQLEKSSV